MLLLAAVLNGVSPPVFSAVGLGGVAVLSLLAGYLVRKRPKKDEELSAGTAYPTRKVRRERTAEDKSKYRREPSVEREEPPVLADPAPEPELSATNTVEVPIEAPRPDPGPPPLRRGPAVSVRREFWAKARERLEVAEPVDLGTGDIMELDPGNRVDRPVLEPVRHPDGGTRIIVPPRMGEPRFDACFDLAGMRDYPEDRDWAQIPELVNAERLQHVRNRREAVDQLEDILEKYEDFDRVYLWMAQVLREEGRQEDVTQVLLQGLAEARSKAPLLTALGIYSVEDGRLADAIRWLVRAVSLQKGGGASNAPQAFRYLACLASAHPRLNTAADWLNDEAAKIDPGGSLHGRANAEFCSKLSQTNTQPWMLDVIEALHGFYGARVAQTVDPAEV